MFEHGRTSVFMNVMLNSCNRSVTEYRFFHRKMNISIVKLLKDPIGLLKKQVDKTGAKKRGINTVKPDNVEKTNML